MSKNNSSNFIRDIIDKDLLNGKNDSKVHTRFPPEPNGYLHIGHAKSIFLNFELAKDYKRGKCNLRFDDTNPLKENDEYVNSIIQDVKWLGYNVDDKILFASDYFEKMYEYAKKVEQNHIGVIIAGAGGSAHLPGMISALTHVPVLGVPVESKKLKGLDSLLSIAQMPKGIPVGTLAIG